MPLTDRDPNINSGRNSRASYLSADSGGFHKPHSSQNEHLSSNPGVMSMLRTTTELGDIAGLAVSKNRPPSMPRPVHHPRSRPSSRLSTSSSQSHATRHMSNHQPWSSVSSGPRRSLTSTLNVPNFHHDGVPGHLLSLQSSSSHLQSNFAVKNERSFSLTYASPQVHTISNPRSFTSLRSNDPVSRPQSPYRYPARLRRPTYRPSSPAMSDVTGTYPRRAPGSGHVPRLRAPTISSELSEDKVRVAAPYLQHRNQSAPTVATVHTVHSEPARSTSHHPLGGVVAIPAKELTSSHSTSSGTVAGASSSDPTFSSPSTPKDASSLPILVGHALSGSTSHTPTGLNALESADGPLYYDYSEHFEREMICKTAAPDHSLGFVHRIRAILDGKTYENTQEGASVMTWQESSISAPVELAATEIQPEMVEKLPPKDDKEEIAELPASPVIAKRITRELVHAALCSSSSSEPAETTGSITVEVQVKRHPASSTEESVESGSIYDRAAASSSGTITGKRQSIASESTSTSLMSVPSSVARSSRISIAVREGGPKVPSLPSIASIDISHDSDYEHNQQSSSEFGHSQESNGAVDGQNYKEQCETAESKDMNSTSIKPVEELSKHKELIDAIAKERIEKIPSSCESSCHPEPSRKEEKKINTGESQTTGTTSVKVTSVEIIKCHPSCSDSGALANAPAQSSILPMPTDTSVTSIATHAPEQSITSPPLSKVPPKRDGNLATHLVWNSRSAMSAALRDSLERRASLHFGELDPPVDLRLSNFRYPGGGGYLPDVQEDPHEDSTISGSRCSQRTSRQSGAASSFKFPLPQSLAHKASSEDLRLLKRSSIRSSVGKGGSRATMMTLAETRALPSLNFSRMNLIAKLNEALELRASRSLDGVPSDFQLVEGVDDIERPASAGSMREKYRSFFASLDELEVQVEDAASNISRPLEEEINRPCSPDELITEVNQLSIPSVAGLTQRLSELLPSFKRYCEDDGEEELEVTDEELLGSILNEVHEAGVKTLNPVRSSARLRALPGRSSLCVIEDDVYEEISNKRNSFPIDEASSARNRDSYISTGSSSKNKDATPVTDLETPVPAHIRPTTPEQNGDDVSEAQPARLSPMLSSPASTRPWNNDSNYPWSDSMPAINIKLPAPTHQRHGSRHGSRHGCSTLHRISCSSRCSPRSSSEDLTSPTIADRSASNDTSTSTTTDVFIQHTRKPSKRAGFPFPTAGGPSIDATGYATRPEILCEETRPVDPGDRYPTTGLTPPSAFNLEEVRSFFSDDSSHTRRAGTFRKRLTNLRMRVVPPRSQSAMDSRAVDRAAATAAGPGLLCGPGTSGSGSGASSNNERAAVAAAAARSSSTLSPDDSHVGANSSIHTFDGTGGMSRMEFRAKKVFERIKSLWYRSAEAFRTWSMSTAAKRRKEEREEWLRDSDVYSGT